MERRFLVLGLVGVVVLGVVSGSSAATPAVTQWGRAAEVPNTATLNLGGSASVTSVSCGAAGDCVAAGYYEDGAGHNQAFIASEKNGRWAKAVEVPGTAALNSGGSAGANSVSCSAAGACVVGGYYKDGSGNFQAFVVNETSGSWGTAVEVPGTATLNTGGDAVVESVSCATAGNCAAGGFYYDGSGNKQVFVASETNGSWGDAIAVPGSATLNSGGNAFVGSVSCGAAGDCAAGGQYKDGSGHYQAFVVGETSGSWGDAVEVPGSATLNGGGAAEVTTVSCSGAGDCAAGGGYADSSLHYQAFVVGETNGSWGNAVEVPGSATLNAAGDAAVESVSCVAAGACEAGGFYRSGSGHEEALVASETNGTWGNAAELPGTAKLNSGGSAQLVSISCTAAGMCAAGGYYTDGSDNGQAFVASQEHGRWSRATEVPGMATLNKGDAGVLEVSCAPGVCAAAGQYTDGSTHAQAFVADSAPACIVPHVVGKALSAATRTLKAAHCPVGKITRVHSTSRKGRVVAQTPRAGTHLTPGRKVALTVSRGKK